MLRGHSGRAGSVPGRGPVTPPERMSTRGPAAAAIVLLLAFAFQSFGASRTKSATFDEPAHIGAGLAYLQAGAFVANAQHPPLLKQISALSMLAGGIRLPDTPSVRAMIEGIPGAEFAAGVDVLQAYGPDRVLFWARLPLIAVATLLGALLFVWGRKLLGDGPALGAVMLYTLNPTIIAHGALVTTDVGCAAATVLFIFTLWQYVQQPGGLRLIACGLALGAALATKYSAVALWPIGGILLLAATRWPDRSHPLRLTTCIGAFLAMTGIAIVTIQCIYFLPSDPLVYLSGATRLHADHGAAYPTYLFGRLAAHFRGYFAIVYALKEPLASIALFLFGLAVLVWRRPLSRLRALFLIVPAIVLFAEYTTFARQVGIRYVIPVLPFVHLVAGLGLARLARHRSRWARAAAVGLCTWLIVAAAGVYPDHLSYFNEAACVGSDIAQLGLAGGTRCGPAWLDEHNVDWGQGLKQLKRWLDDQGSDRPVHLAYFGSVPPALYGIHGQIDPLALVVPGSPPAGRYVVSAHFVARLSAVDRVHAGSSGRWLATTEPTAIIGHSLYVYDIGAPPLPAVPHG